MRLCLSIFPYPSFYSYCAVTTDIQQQKAIEHFSLGHTVQFFFFTFFYFFQFTKTKTAMLTVPMNDDRSCSASML